MAIRPKSRRQWCIKNALGNFWQRGSGGWGIYWDRAVYTEADKNTSSLPVGGAWEVDSSSMRQP